MGKILIIGSLNTDMVVKSARLPLPGETVLGGSFMMNPGGKGANQAVAASRLGGEVYFITKTGNDLFGRRAVEHYQEEGINTEYICSDENLPSGVALILVDEMGENSISVAPGANNCLSPADIEAAIPLIESCDIVLLQLEIPIETVQFAVMTAKEKGKKVILNPAPARALFDDTLRNLYMIIPNATEAGILTGVKVVDEESARRAADVLISKGVENVVITLGAKGAFVKAGSIETMIPSEKVKAVDTTAAGDTFCGAMCVALSENRSIPDAVRFACRCSAISVTRMGAQLSIPYRRELL